MLQSNLKKLLNKFGYDIQHLPTNPFVRRQMELFTQYKIDLILDVGANKGQFVNRLRKSGYKGRVISFEPLPDAFKILKSNANRDKNWDVVNTAVGNENSHVTMHVSRNSYSSSILEMLPRHLESANDSEVISEVTVPVLTLDTFLSELNFTSGNIFLKIDTQGFERHVIEGTVNSLKLIKGFQLELSVEQLYAGETLLQEMISLLKKLGFILMAIEHGHTDYTTGEILQVECIFYRPKFD